MSNSSLQHTIGLLLEHLAQTGLLAELELSDEDIADTLWLASHLGIVEAKYAPTKTTSSSSGKVQSGKVTTVIGNPPTANRGGFNQNELGQDEEKDVDVFTEDSIDSEDETFAENQGLPIQVPAAPAILNKLEICRALRPLMRKVPSFTQTIFDEEATVTRIAEKDVWLPVTKPKPERWLDLELVVEESSASFIWQETIDELQQLLETQGAFRNVRVWSLSSLDEKLTKRKKGRSINSGKSPRQYSYRELIHTNGRGLILLVSDCVSPLWQQGKIHNWLKQWSLYQSTAIIQLFPERLWLSSELGLGYKVKFNSFTPVESNAQLSYASPDEDLAESSILNIPVVTLDDEYIKYWARVMAGCGKSQTPGIVFDLEFVQEQAQSLATAETQELSAEIVVDRFLATASDPAKYLAGYMAAAPVCLSVVHLIQKNLLPTSTPVHVAEVFLSGMVQRNQAAEDNSIIKYDFVPGARKILNLAMRLDDMEKVLDVISKDIAKNLGLSIKSFTALLLNFPQYDQQQQQELLPFAHIAIEVLENLGGDYAKFAQEELKAWTDLGQGEPDKYDFSGFPSLQDREYESSTIVLLDGIELLTQQFEVAEIETSIFPTFEFVTAKLERQQKQPGLFQRFNPFRRNESVTEWVIREQTKEAQHLIESLNETVTLEMVLIPPGEFMMGSAPGEQGSSSDEQPQHKVTIPEAFLMGRYPVTQEQWQAVAVLPQVKRKLKVNPSRFKGDKRPVERVSWEDAKEFCARLSKKNSQKIQITHRSRMGICLSSRNKDRISLWRNHYNGIS